MKFLFNPKNSGEQASDAPHSPVAMRKGETHDVSPGWAEKLNGLIDGDNDGPALVAVVEGAEPKAEKPKATRKADKPAAPVTTVDPAVEVT
jgi:hypothetical protein